MTSERRQDFLSDPRSADRQGEHQDNYRIDDRVNPFDGKNNFSSKCGRLTWLIGRSHLHFILKNKYWLNNARDFKYYNSL